MDFIQLEPKDCSNSAYDSLLKAALIYMFGVNKSKLLAQYTLALCNFNLRQGLDHLHSPMFVAALSVYQAYFLIVAGISILDQKQKDGSVYIVAERMATFIHEFDPINTKKDVSEIMAELNRIAQPGPDPIPGPEMQQYLNTSS